MEYTHKVNKLPKNTFEVEVEIPWTSVSQAYEKAFAQLAQELEVDGFRKGKAPKNVADKHIKKDSVYQHLIRTIFPDIYAEVMKKEGIQPIVNPRLELVNAKDNEPWKVKITVAEKPIIKLGEYKKALKEVKDKQKKADIWVPGKDVVKEQTEEEKSKVQQQLLNEMLSVLLANTSVEISDFVLDEELNSRLSRLVDDVQKLGMTMEQYLQSKNITMEAIREQFLKEIEETHKLEFTLNEIAEKEGITVGNEELEKLFGSVKDEKERAAAMQNAYFYAALLRKQKTLDYLLNL